MIFLYFTIGLMLTLAIIIPQNVYALHESAGTITTPTTQFPITSNDLGTGTDDDTDPYLENPDEVQPQYGGPQGDPFCKITRTLADSKIGQYMELNKYEKRCGDLDGENTEEDNLTMLKSARDSEHTPIDLKNEISVGLDMIDCEKNDLTDSLSSNEREECDNLMLQVQAECEDNPRLSSVSFLSSPSKL